MTPKEFLKDKKVLIMGLGFFGGGAAGALWAAKFGARVTVTDLKNESELKKTLACFSPRQRKKITFILGRHRKTDFKTNDIIIVNPSVPGENPFLNTAREHNKDIQNDASLFFQFAKSPVIAVTGTRGKTTTTNWISQILSHTFGPMEPVGNSTNNPLLKELKNAEDLKKPVVVELSSWQLELLPRSSRAPHIACITNIYPDHLNRHKSMTQYAAAKANLFKHQKESDFLILNHECKWKKYFLDKKPKSQVYFFSTKKLPKSSNGVFVKNGKIILQKNGVQKEILSLRDFEKRWGHHNLENLLASILAVKLYKPRVRITQKIIQSLTEIPLRQETIYKNKKLTIINDSASTSPDALISALLRFGKKPNTVFICGGTSKNLPFAPAARSLKQTVPPKNLILLSGSATNDFLKELKKMRYFKKEPQIFETLNDCVNCALKTVNNEQSTIVFSPGAASFEKFENEFDRGAQFNKLIHRLGNNNRY